jgi:PhoH-like ATPase
VNVLNVYSGFTEIHIKEDRDIELIYENCKDLNLNVNEYLLVIQNNMVVDRFRWDGSSLLSLADIKYKAMNIPKPLDDAQRCAYDLILNKDIPVVALTGKAGTGKTNTAVNVALALLDTYKYEKILLLRNPTYSGKELGHFPGDKGEKLFDGGWIGCFIDNLSSGYEGLISMINNGKIELEITSLIKGRDYKNMIIVVDEAQDLFMSDVKSIGTRIHDVGCKLIFCADTQQVANKSYTVDSGITHLVNTAKGQDWFGTIELQANGRGSIASWFGDSYID